MTLYVLDTDHLSLFERGHSAVSRRILKTSRSDFHNLTTTVVSMEEQLKGRLAQINKAATVTDKLILAYQRLNTTFSVFASLNVLEYSATADKLFREFRKARIRIGTQDLRIASITLFNNGVLLTRNRRDFEKVPDLLLQDWSVDIQG